MLVEVKPLRMLDAISKRERDGGQYQICVDGRLAGFIGYRHGACPRMHREFSPLELREIESQVRRQLIPQEIGPIKQPGRIITPIPLPDHEGIESGDFD